MTKTETPTISAEQALALLDEIWAYYTPAPAPVDKGARPDLSQYADAA